MSDFCAVYVFSAKGKELVEEHFYRDESQLKEIISVGIINQAKELLENIKLDSQTITLTEIINGLTYNIKQFGDISVVIVMDVDHKVGTLLHRLGWQFLRQYHQIDLIQATRSDGQFSDFKSVIQDEMDDFFAAEEFMRMKGRKQITPVVIYDLAYKEQQVAISLLAMQSATLSQLREETDLNSEELKYALDKLLELGYIYEKEDNGEFRYSI